MKQEIVRTPETDRKKINIPTLLPDLTDYESSVATGIAHRDTYERIPNGATRNQVFDAYTELRNVAQNVQGLRVQVSGMFYIHYYVHWQTQTFGANAGDVAPAVNLRGVDLYVNGVYHSSAVVSGSQNGTDTGVAFLRLAAESYVEVKAYNNDPTANSGASPRAHLSLAKIAP